ncbi:hypothetical protein [Nioella aestuarii]|uniref:hypothetical protein n=1 Tax=Nioella aestuarii TaxID=1662864 RepID=UPI003D7F65B3
MAFFIEHPHLAPALHKIDSLRSFWYHPRRPYRPMERMTAMQQLFRIVLFAVLCFFGHGSAAEAQAQLVQRECRPQVVNTLSFSMSVPIFPELYNASAEEVA